MSTSNEAGNRFRVGVRDVRGDRVEKVEEEEPSRAPE
jgi:hypothetical protein